MFKKKAVKVEVMGGVTVVINDPKYRKKIWVDEVTLEDGKKCYEVRKEITKVGYDNKTVAVINPSHSRH